MAKLDMLPLEMINAITQHLDVGSVLQFKRTNRDLYAAVSLESLPKTIRIEFLSKAEKFPCNARRYACFKCLHMLPSESFGCHQRRGKFAFKNTRRRFCLDCAAKLHLYSHGRMVYTYGREIVYLCYKCDRYSTRLKRCGIPGSDDQNFEKPEWVCWSDSDAVGTPSLLSLPKLVLGRIVSAVSYKDAIALSSTCVALKFKIDLSDVTLHERFRFTRDTSLRVGLGENRLACYVCFRVLPGTAFTDRQLDMSRREPSTFYKRRCGTCLYRLYGNLDSGKLLEEWNSRMLYGPNEPKTYDNLEYELAKKCEQELRPDSLDKKFWPKDLDFSTIAKILKVSVSWATFETPRLELDLRDPTLVTEAPSASTVPGQRIGQRRAFKTLRERLGWLF